MFAKRNFSMKNVQKYLLLFAFVISCISICFFPILLLSLGKDGLSDKDFYENKSDLINIVEFIYAYENQIYDEDNICFGVDSNATSGIILTKYSESLSSTRVELDETTRESLLFIKDLFDSKKCFLDRIRISNDYITFETLDGQYTLVYSINKKRPDKTDSETNMKFKVTRIDDHWFHKYRKNSIRS
jgi:hypothetical protein